MTPQELQVVHQQLSAARKHADNPWAYAYSTDVPPLINEVERLNTENTYHSLQLDRAREEIERLRGALDVYQHPHSWEYRQSDVPGEYAEEFVWNRFGDPKEIANKALAGDSHDN